MSNELIDSVKRQLIAEENDELRRSVYSVYLEAPERAANMVVDFLQEKKGLKLDADQFEASKTVVLQAMNEMDDDDLDIKLTPEILTTVTGGKSKAKKERNDHVAQAHGNAAEQLPGVMATASVNTFHIMTGNIFG